MIGWLEGVLLHKKAPVLCLNVQGVGYEITAPMTTIFELPEPGSKVALYIHHQARDDGQYLYGFSREQDKELFRVLIRINGVGPKMALAILSTMSAQDLALAVGQDNIAAMTAIPGVGKKTAERLIVELRDKLDTAQLASTEQASPHAEQVSVHDSLADAIAALESLGYKTAEASKMIKTMYKPGLSSEELIKQALRQLSGR